MANLVRQPISVADQLALGQKYGPTTGPALQRSQYLADALKSLDESAQQGIRTKGALWANLLSQGLLTYGKGKADTAALDAYAKDQSDETNSALTGLEPREAAPPPPPQMPQPPPQAAPQPPPQMPPQAQAGPPPAQPGAPTPEVLELARMVYGEARGEKPEGQNAVAAVALNRAKKSGKPLADILAAPHQFEGYNAQSRSQSPQALASILQNIAPALGGQDPTGGAQNFLNPDLQAQMGRSQPKWAPGNGQRIGNHVFYGGQPGAQQMAQAQAAPPVDPAAAMGNAGADPFPPSPGPQPAAGQAPAPGGALQPSGAGAGPQQQQQWPTWKPSQQEVDYVKRMLNNPRTHAEGLKIAQGMQQKMTQPMEAVVQIVNGVPTYIPKDPTAGIGPQTMAVPQAAMSQTLTAEQAGVQAPPGTTFNRDPTGNMKQVYQPQNGQQVTSAPGRPYTEAPIQGGTNDPRAPAARFNNEGKLRDDYAKEVAPYVAAREGYQKVVQAAGDMSQAGAIALVFGYMKTLDPGSTVREGEQASVQNSGTIPQTITNMYNKLIAGQSSLSPEQRQQFAQSAKGQFDVYQRTFDAANQRYGDLAQNYGMDPGNVTRHFDPIAEFKAPQGSRGAVPEAAKNAYQQRFQKGLIDPKAPFGDKSNPYQARDAATLHALDVPANRGKYVIGPDGQFGIID